MTANKQILAIRVIITAVAMMFCAGCATVPTKTAGGKITPYFISSNVAGAQVLTENGNIVGETPVQGQIKWEGWDKWWSPYGEMIEVERIAHPLPFRYEL